MTEKGYPWDSYQEDKREYGAQNLANAFSAIVKNGVVNEAADFLVEPLNGSSVRVGAGTAWINGHTVSILGYEDITIPYEGNPSGPTRYGRLVLRCREETEHRDFEIAFKSQSSGETPALEDNEISLARIAITRSSAAVAAEDIVRDVTPVQNVNVETRTNINGLLMGHEGNIVKAVDGTDYISPKGGEFTGNITKSGILYQTVDRKEWGNVTDENGKWTTEFYSDGFCRMYCHVLLSNCEISRISDSNMFNIFPKSGDTTLTFRVRFPNGIVMPRDAITTAQGKFGDYGMWQAFFVPFSQQAGWNDVTWTAYAMLLTKDDHSINKYYEDMDVFMEIAGWME